MATDSTTRTEYWVRLDTQEFSVRLARFQVIDEKVLVTEESLDALFTGTNGTGKIEDSWQVTYPVVSELLTDRGYRKWE